MTEEWAEALSSVLSDAISCETMGTAKTAPALFTGYIGCNTGKKD